MADRKRNEVAIEIEAMLAKAEVPKANKCCIFKVPHRLHKLNEDAYTPRIVSIGPFHHGCGSLGNMESHKQKFLKRFIERTQSNLDSLVRHVEELEPMVHGCYSENIELSEKELVKIILVDAGFILELFCWDYYEDWNSDDIISLNSWLIEDVKWDLLLLENQLPFFVLNAIYNRALATCPQRGNFLSFLGLTFQVFRVYNSQELVPESIPVCYHFTDLLRTFYLQPSDRHRPRENRFVELLYTVTELHEAGVKFKANQTSHCLLDLKFSGRVLEIPRIRVYDSTERVFRNMLALEQCLYLSKAYITDYVTVLDYLVNKEKDVDVLVRKGIVNHWLGENNDVAKLVNGLGKNILHIGFSSDYYDICNNLNAFCKDPWHIKKATLRRDYCKTPWQTAASVAAILILILTLIQAVCSILQVVK